MTGFRDNISCRDRLGERGFPLVLAIASQDTDVLRERLVQALASSCCSQGGRALVLEGSGAPGHLYERLATQPALAPAGFPGSMRVGPEGVVYAQLESLDPGEVYLALQALTSPPPRFNLVLSNIRSRHATELFLASLAQRTIFTTSAGSSSLQEVRSTMRLLSDLYHQDDFALAVAAEPEAARAAYRVVMENLSRSGRQSCELLDTIPRELYTESDVECPAEDLQKVVDGVWRDVLPNGTSGGLQIFWRCLLFCRTCSLRLCQGLQRAGRELEVCPLEGY